MEIIMRKKVLLVNFGGPRSCDEVHPFLKELLTDHDVIRTPIPQPFQDLLFKYIAKKRSKKIAEDYHIIGGKSPIFEDTEWMASALRDEGFDVLTFHRYLPMTHGDFLEKASEFITDDVVVFPLFPQFSYSTTGSIARWMQKNLCRRKAKRLSWVKSYSEDDGFIASYVNTIKQYMQSQELIEEESLLFFSPHGLPVSYVFEGDPYMVECQRSYHKIIKAFPRAGCIMGFQSQFGKAEWIKPYTNELSDTIAEWNVDYKNVVFIPLSFTSDHIETLFEVQYQYLPAVKDAGFNAYRCPALNRREDWVKAVASVIRNSDLTTTEMLIRDATTTCACGGSIT